MKARQLIDALKALPCEDCGGSFIAEAMEFDHPPEVIKAFEISSRRGATFLQVATELEKCDIVCANCHRARTNRRRDKAEGEAIAKEIAALLAGGPMTAREIQSALRQADDRRIRLALRRRFDVYPGTGTSRLNPARWVIR